MLHSVYVTWHSRTHTRTNTYSHLQRKADFQLGLFRAIYEFTDDKIDNTYDFYESNNNKNNVCGNQEKATKNVTKQMLNFYRLMRITCGLNTNINTNVADKIKISLLAEMIPFTEWVIISLLFSAT